MIRDFFESFFDFSTWFDKLIGTLIILLVIAVVALVTYVGYILVDGSGSKVYRDDGIVYYGEFVPEHIATTYVTSGKVSTPIFTHYDDAWYLDVSVTDGAARAKVSQSFYLGTNINDSVTIEYTRGVIKKSNIYIKNIEKLKLKR